MTKVYEALCKLYERRMSTIHIRAATLEDLPAIELIEKSCFSDDRRSSPRVLRHSFKSPTQSIWVAVAGRETAGAMALWHYPRSLRIFSVAVLPAYRGGGTGRRLVEKALELAKQTGCAAVTLEADKSNHVLTGWYENFGFEIKQTLRDYYSPGRHAVRMRLEWKKIQKNVAAIHDRGRRGRGPRPTRGRRARGRS